MTVRTLSLILAMMFCTAPAFAAVSPDTVDKAQQPRMLFRLTNMDAEAAIAGALADKGAGKKLAAHIIGRKGDVLYSYSKPVVAEIHGLRYDSMTHRWNASVLFRSGDDIVSAVPASGTYEEVVEVPVLRREVRNNAVITEDDVEIREFPIAQTRSDTVTTVSDLLGKSPLRYISAERPIRMSEIARPSVVKRNSLVQILFESGPLHITTTGEALQDGATGDVINVRNTASKRVVRATVESEGVVRVVPIGTLPNASVTSNNTSDGGDHATN